MSLFRRLSRAWDTHARPRLDPRTLYGARGEEYVGRLFSHPAILGCVTNPIVPASGARSYPLESDFLVYTYGNLYCIEVKRLKGRITYGTPSPASEHGTLSPLDESVIVQHRWSRSGLPQAPKIHPDPLKKTNAFIGRLKAYLGENVDARFRTLPIISVVAFVEEADISDIHSFERGIIYASELSIFFQRNVHPTFASSPSNWIIKGMRYVPTSDLILTTDNEPFRGFLVDHYLDFKKLSGGDELLPLSMVRSAWLEHSWLFSAASRMTIFLADGSCREVACTAGTLQMQGFDKRLETHKLRNVRKIVIGKRERNERSAGSVGGVGSVNNRNGLRW